MKSYHRLFVLSTFEDLSPKFQQMTPKVDEHVELAQLQNEIADYLGVNPKQLFFDYSNKDNKVVLDLITINPRHSQSFLFHTEVGVDKVDATAKMISYVKNYKEKEASYTIQWMAKGDKELHTSYFSASNMYLALDKLYYGRDINTITIFSVVLNPVT